MSKRLQTIKDFLRLRDYDTAQRLLEQLTKRLLKKPPGYLGQLVWPIEQLAILYRRKKNFEEEIELLKAYVAVVGPNPHNRYEQYLVERLLKAHELASRFVPDRGMCEMCDALDRKLTRIESGHLVCETCRRVFLPPPRKKHWATVKRIEYFRSVGFDVPDDLTRTEAERIERIDLARRCGACVGMKSSDETIQAALNSIIQSFETRVSGVTHRNLDGTSRQQAIQSCRVGDRVELIRDPENPFDPLAVKVCRLEGDQIGYLPAAVVRNDYPYGMDVSAQMDKGIEFCAQIVEIAHFASNGTWFSGVDLLVRYWPFKGF